MSKLGERMIEGLKEFTACEHQWQKVERDESKGRTRLECEHCKAKMTMFDDFEWLRSL